MKSRFLAMLVALMMLLSLSCASAEALRSLPEEQTITIAILEGVNSNKENNLVEVTLQDRLNVKLEYTYVPSASFDEKINTVLASGELPDIVCFLWKNTVPVSWVEQGAVLRLDDPENNLLEKYAPNYSSLITEELKPYAVDYDGGIYSVKTLVDFKYQNSIMLRSDWLENLGLDVPKTMDEFVEVLRHFKNDDPNQNGMQDEIPYMGLNGDLNPFYNAFGISVLNNTYPYVEADGKLIPQYEHPEFKNCVDLLRQMYSEGLIDAEYTIRDIPSRDELVSTDKVGMVAATGNESTKLTKSLRANGFEKALLNPVAPIEGVGGQHIAGRFPTSTSVAITSTAKDPEACLMVLDYLFSEEGRTLTNFGVEGETFEYVNGEPRLIEPYCTSWEQARGVGIAKGTWAEFWSGENFLQITFQGKTLEDLDEVDALAYHAYVDTDEFAYSMLPGSIFDTETNRKISADIWSPLQDEINNYIMGVSEWDSFESLYKELKEYGLDKITEEVNANYDALK